MLIFPCMAVCSLCELDRAYCHSCCRPYEREVAFAIGKHYQTNESLPEDLYQKISASRNYRYASGLPD